MRDSIIKSIISLKEKGDSIVVLDVDCSNSTRSILFKEAYKDSFFNIGIAEQNMIGIAAGLALTDNRLIVNGFANMLCLRSLEFIQQLIAKQNLPVIILGHYAGLSAAQEGASHHSINALSVMRSIPNIHIYNPFGNRNAVNCLIDAYRNRFPAFINVAKVSFNEPLSFAESLNILDSGSGSQRLVICTGVILEQVMQARQIVESHNMSFDILALSSINNLQLVRRIACYKDIWLVEEAYKYGGIYPLLCTALIENKIYKTINHICIETFTRSGEMGDLYDLYKISANKIAEAICK